MTWHGTRLAAAVLAAGAAAGLSAGLLPVARPAADAAPLAADPGSQEAFQTPNFSGAVYGDFAVIGNSVLRCPKPNETGGDQSANCVAATHGQQPADQNGFYRQLSPGDGVSTFDQSQATLTVPAGATVKYAQLNWGGDTGRNDLDLPLPGIVPPSTAPTTPVPATAVPATAAAPIPGTGPLPLPLPLPLPSLPVPALPLPLPLVSPDAVAPTSTAPSLSVPLPVNTCTGLDLSQLPANLLQPVQPPPAPASANPQTQNVRLAVASKTGTGQPAEVQPTNFGVSEQSLLGLVSTPIRMYSAYADVTGQLAQAVSQAGVPNAVAPASRTTPPPTTLTVTVGNVWGLRGHGCSAGWSLDVVFGYPSAEAAPQQYGSLREVDVYTDRFLQGQGMSSTFAIPGLNNDVNRAGSELGLTAFGGDGDRSGGLTVGGKAQNDPCSAEAGGSAGFFSSCAFGALDPLTPGAPIQDNLSVDAKAIEPDPASASDPPGSSVQIGLSGTSDPYLLQNIVLSEYIHPTLGVAVAGPAQAVHADDPAPVGITVQNTGDVVLYNTAAAVSVNGAPASCPGLPGQLGTLAPGDVQTLQCTVTAPNATFPLTATATGDFRLNDPQTRISGSATTKITVIGPALAMTLSADPLVVRGGQPATLTFTVTNTSPAEEGSLTPALSTVPALPDCHPAPVAAAPPGYQVTTTCTFTPAKDTVVAATATVKDSHGATASASSPKVTVTVMHPSLDIAVVAEPSEVETGKPVNFTVAVHNTGDVTLAVNVTDDVANACDFTTSQQGLLPGTAQSQKCTLAAPAQPGPFVDTAQFSATPMGQTKSKVQITGSAVTQPITGHGAGTAQVRPAGSLPSSASSNAGHTGSAAGTEQSGTNQVGGPNSGTGKKSTPGLAYTGFAIGGPLLLAAVLLVTGVALRVWRPRRRSTRGR